MRRSVRTSRAVAATVTVLALAGRAHAHISITSGPAVANATQEVTFGVGHGCSGADTLKVKIDLPASVTSVRTGTNNLGAVSIQKDSAQNPISVTWEKPITDLLSEDTNYYKLTVRLKTPDKPFTTLYFPAHQTCRTTGGVVSTVDWVALPGDAVPEGGAELEPAPALNLVPAHFSGWNKFTLPVAITELDAFFKDAAIVWRGSQAYSSNPATADLITKTSGVTPLTGGLLLNDQIWVKY